MKNRKKKKAFQRKTLHFANTYKPLQILRPEYLLSYEPLFESIPPWHIIRQKKFNAKH